MRMPSNPSIKLKCPGKPGHFSSCQSLGAMRSAFVFFISVIACSLSLAGARERWHEVNGGGWSVSAAVVSHMRDQLQRTADQVEAKRGRRAATLSAYTVQYQGIFDGASRLVRLSGQCKAGHLSVNDLQHQWYDHFDGGECYFTATYDPRANRYVNFRFNGVA